jgi:hypothetical protein
LKPESFSKFVLSFGTVESSAFLRVNKYTE